MKLLDIYPVGVSSVDNSWSLNWLSGLSSFGNEGIVMMVGGGVYPVIEKIPPYCVSLSIGESSLVLILLFSSWSTREGYMPFVDGRWW